MDTGLSGGAVHNVPDVEKANVQLLLHAEYFKIRHQLFAPRTTDSRADDLHIFNFPCGSVRWINGSMFLSVDPLSTSFQAAHFY